MYKYLDKLNTSLINIGHVSLDSRWDYDNVISSFTRLYYIDEGAARVYHHNEVFDLKPGYMYLIPSFTYCRYKCDEFMSQYYVSFFEEVGDGISVYNLMKFNYKVKGSEQDLRNFKRLLALNPDRSLKNDDPEYYDNHPVLSEYQRKSEKMSSSAFLESKGLLLSLFARFISNEEAGSKNDSATAQRIMESVQYIHENMAGNLSVEHVAEVFHLHPDYYSRSFKSQIGIRPVKYIQTKRIERAQTLLTTTSDTIPEIATKIGLSNLSYFSRLFKRHTGMSPGRFRKQ